MNSSNTRQALRERADYHRVAVSDSVADRVVVYFELLQHWNHTINLTALAGTPEGIDRLLLEPLAAAQHVPHGQRLLDLGTGSGSPAFPLAIATAATRLGMVESRSRKAAFLREVVRQLELSTATVFTERVETLSEAADFKGAWDMVSARGIRIDSPLVQGIRDAIAPGGTLVLFVSKQMTVPSPFRPRPAIPLLRGVESFLVLAELE